MRAIADDYRAFYPSEGDPDLTRDIGLLRPRFGMPVIAKSDDAIAIEALVRNGGGKTTMALLTASVSDEDAARCSPGEPIEGCVRLRLDAQNVTYVARNTNLHRYHAQPEAPVPPGAYDLYVSSSSDAPVRAHRTVWLRETDPKGATPITVIQLSDLHVGKGKSHEERLESIIKDVNHLHPDLVLVTGDITDNGENRSQGERAQKYLRTVDAPVMVMAGNHDLGLGPKSIWRGSYHVGWPNFAQAFHPFLLAELDLAGWRFLGFDSGASVFSPLNLTRGLSPESLLQIQSIFADTSRQSMQGVIAFSHAPSRARLSEHGVPSSRGAVAQMRDGAIDFEKLLLAHQGSGHTAIHLSGHTHWNDLFMSAQRGGKTAFVHIEDAASTGCEREVTGAALVNVQSATHSGLDFLRPSAAGWGFLRMRLNEGPPRIAFHRYGVKDFGGLGGRCAQASAHIN